MNKNDLFKKYEKVALFGISYAKRTIALYDPFFIGVAGSFARGDILEGISDIDIICLCHKPNSQSVLSRQYFYGVKIGFTSFTPDIGKDPFYKADSKLYYVLRGIHLNNVKPYHGDKRDVPFVSLDDLINYHTLEAVERKINHVRQDLVGLQSMPPKNSNDYIPIIKHYHVLMKIGLLLNRVEVEGYDQVYNEFYSILSDHNFIKLPRMLDVFADLTSNDYAVILNSIELFTNQFSEFNRARG